MAVSRSAAEFQRRNGVVLESRRPAPRLSIPDLLVHYQPTPNPPHPDPAALRRYEGDPPPDRGGTRPWPVPTDAPHE